MKPKIHMIGNAHLDPVWLWVWQDGLEVAQQTCRDAVDLLDKHPDYKFSRSSAAVYQWVERTDPELFSRIKKHVDGGRWNIVNGWWVQPDCNIPSGESLVRQGLYGQLYFKERFGKRAKVGFNVDTFGHCGTLPQILRKLGLKYYVFMRPDPREKTLPSNLFWWQSPDGSRVIVDRIHSYDAGDLEDVERKFNRSAARSRESGLDSMCFYGHGDHGGGPIEEMVEKIEDMRNEVEEFEVDFSTPDEFFEALESLSPELPVVVDDLQHHSRGCYTVVSEIKRANRRLESALVNAEKFSSMAFLHLGAPYPRDILRRSWETLLFHQFHDIMGGTSIEPAYDDASKSMQMAIDMADSVAEFAMEALSARIDTAGDGKPILVFNPAPCAREDPIHFEAILPGDEKLVALDESGVQHPLQINSSVDFKDEKRVSGSFIAGIPPVGYRVFWIKEGEPNGTDVTAGGNSVENSLIRISVDPSTGYLCSVFDKTTGTEYLKHPSRPIVIQDDSDTWSHDVEVFGDEIGTFRIEGEPSIEIGPVGGSISVSSTYGNSRIIQTFSIRSGSPLVECTLDLDWHERHTMLKLSFPVDVIDPRAIYEIPYGTIERSTQGQEEPGQRWLDLLGKDGEGKEKGMLMVNDSKYGFSVDGSEMMVSIVRSPIFAFHRPRKPEPGKAYVYTDQGKHRVGLLLYPHFGAASEDKFQLAERFNNPPIVAFANSHQGSLPSVSSLVSCEPGNVIIGALKVAEEHDAIILRLFESAGRQTRFDVTFPLLGIEFTADIGPWEIKTLAVSSDGKARETDLLE